jgi:hypothetical protein
MNRWAVVQPSTDWYSLVSDARAFAEAQQR